MNLDAIRHICKQSIFDLTYVFSKYNETSLTPINTKVFYKAPLECLPQEKSSGSVNIVDSQYFNQIFDLALIAGHFSRFKLDTRFPNQVFEGLYKRWVENSFQAYHTVLSIGDKETLKGMVSLKLKESAGISNIELIGVHNAFQGQQIGKKLLALCAQHIKAHSALGHLSVQTQLENKGACRFYERYGFQKQHQVNIFHFWK